MKKLKQKTLKYFDYNEMRDHVAEKYGINEWDYKHSRSYDKQTKKDICEKHKIDYEVWSRTKPADMDEKMKACDTEIWIAVSKLAPRLIVIFGIGNLIICSPN